MSWLWSDELAALLIEQGLVEPGAIADWVHRPQGHAVPDGADPLEVARGLLAAQRDDLRRAS